MSFVNFAVTSKAPLALTSVLGEDNSGVLASHVTLAKATKNGPVELFIQPKGEQKLLLGTLEAPHCRQFPLNLTLEDGVVFTVNCPKGGDASVNVMGTVLPADFDSDIEAQLAAGEMVNSSMESDTPPQLVATGKKRSAPSQAEAPSAKKAKIAEESSSSESDDSSSEVAGPGTGQLEAIIKKCVSKNKDKTEAVADRDSDSESEEPSSDSSSEESVEETKTVPPPAKKAVGKAKSKSKTETSSSAEDDDSSDSDSSSTDHKQPRAAASKKMPPAAAPSADSSEESSSSESEPPAPPAKEEKTKVKAGPARNGPPVKSKGPHGKWENDLVAYLKANGRVSAAVLGGKVRKPANVAEKLAQFVKARPAVFECKGGMVSLVKK